MINLLNQSLALLLKKGAYEHNKIFRDILGHDNIKQILLKSVASKRPVHILLVGPPGSGKTLFLTHIMKKHKESYFVVGSNTTKAGLVNQLFRRRPRFLLVDELEKMSPSDQTSLLHLMETGIISETKVGKTRQIGLTAWVFATANSYKRIIRPLLSRFIVLEVPQYTVQEFIDIAISRLEREHVDEESARDIAKRVWCDLGSRDIRDVIKISRLATNVEEVNFVVRMMKKLSYT